MVIDSGYDRINTANPAATDAEVLAMIRPYKEQLEVSMDVILAFLEEDLLKEQPEGTLGNHIAAITYDCAQANYNKEIDFSIMNYGGLRVPYVNAGPLKARDAYQIMPFDNYVVIMEVEGNVVLELADRMAGNGGWPVHNMTYLIDGTHASDVLVNGKTVEPLTTYHMAISDYLAGGGDQLDLLKKYEYSNTGILLRDAIMEYWENTAEQGNTILEQKDGRVRVK